MQSRDRELVPEGAWERRRRLIRREIERVALQLYAEQGYDDVGVEQIAVSAGISVRTFFRYFSSKDDVLLAMPVRVLESMCEAVECRPADEPLLAAWRAVAVSAGHWDAQDLAEAQLFRAALTRSPDLRQRIHGHPVLRGRFRASVAARLRADQSDLRAGVLAGAIQGAMVAALDSWAEGDHAQELTAVFTAAFDLLGDDPEFTVATGAGGPRRVSRRAAR